jgi:GNAT superfamily N-acetyltransferase
LATASGVPVCSEQFTILPEIIDMHLRAMTNLDVSAGVRLNTLAGWNQTASDWHRFLDASPAGCFVAEENGEVRGTATTMTYENRFAWIGMVLVDPEVRKQGIGTQLLNATIQYLDQRKISTWKLDATPQGQPLYRKLGFVPEYEIERWILKRAPDAMGRTSRSHQLPLTETQWELILHRDREVFGADRSFLLRSLRDGAPDLTISVWSDGLPQGYAFGRSGLFADHLGAWVTQTPTVAQNLLQEFLTRSSRETLLVDCLKANTMAIDLLRSHGFVRSRLLTRMFRGPNHHPGSPESLCAIVGPEFG